MRIREMEIKKGGWKDGDKGDGDKEGRWEG